MGNDESTASRHALELIHPRSLKHLSGKLRTLIRSRLWLQVLVAMLLGIAVGLLLGPSVGWVPPDTGAVVANWLALPGKLFLVMIQMVVIPLVFASIIRGLAATEDIDQLRRTGTQVVVWFVATTVLAIVIGITLAGIIQPGRFIYPAALRAAAASAPAEAEASLPSLAELPQTLISVLPTNPLNSMVEAQMLQVVIFALFIGIALVMMPAAQPRRVPGRLCRLGETQPAGRLADVAPPLLRAKCGYYVPSAVLNAFAVGNRNAAAIAVTDGMLRSLTFRELAGVLAHEVSHIANNDLWVMNLADATSRVTALMSYLGIFLLAVNIPLIAADGGVAPWLLVLLLIVAPTLMDLLQLALQRAREFDADLDAVRLTGETEGLASALAKLESWQGRFWERVLFPGRRVPDPSLLRTHSRDRGARSSTHRAARRNPVAAPVASGSPRGGCAGDDGTGCETSQYRWPGIWY